MSAVSPVLAPTSAPRRPGFQGPMIPASMRYFRREHPRYPHRHSARL